MYHDLEVGRAGIVAGVAAAAPAAVAVAVADGSAVVSAVRVADVEEIFAERLVAWSEPLIQHHVQELDV